MSKIDIEKLICSWMEARVIMSDNECNFVQAALRDQGLEYKDGKIVPIGEPIITPSEFDFRLNSLLKEFEELPQNELVETLDFYLDAVKKQKDSPTPVYGKFGKVTATNIKLKQL